MTTTIIYSTDVTGLVLMESSKTLSPLTPINVAIHVISMKLPTVCTVAMLSM